jgi:hypothetical protein
LSSSSSTSTANAEYVTDFSEYDSTADILEEWTQLQDFRFDPVLTSGAPAPSPIFGTRTLSYNNKIGFSGRGVLVRDSLNWTFDSEILVLVRYSPAFDRIIGPSIRIRKITREGYELHIYNPNELRIVRYGLNDTPSTLAIGSFSSSADIWYWMRFRAESNNLYGKIWEYGSSETGSWTVTATQPSPFVSGAPGINYHWNNTYDGYCDYFAVETNSANWPIPIPTP